MTTLKGFIQSKQPNKKVQGTKQASVSTKDKTGVSAEKSKDIMASMYNELDETDAQNADRVLIKPTKETMAFNQEDMLNQKYDLPIGPVDPPSGEHSSDKENEVNMNKKSKSPTQETPVPPRPEPHTNGGPLPVEEPSVSNMDEAPMEVDEDWEAIKKQNQPENEAFNKPDFEMQAGKKDLPLNEDGTLSIFWYDVYEEYNDNGVVYLFGKCYDNKAK